MIDRTSTVPTGTCIKAGGPVLTSRGLAARFVTYRRAYCASTVDVVAGVDRVIGPRKCCVVTTFGFSSPALAAGHTAEFKPRPLLICILASVIVYIFISIVLLLQWLLKCDTRTAESL
jgi:hypothetical protein